ncbi:MAG: ankyrin repeat domain-containing protein [Cyclobacteriaceae bacterium]|nr:ankyrin repeat domain-containing protein [Cyclobacteriaceae bacterium]
MKTLTSFLLVIFLLLACSTKEKLTGEDYQLFKDTPAWELAKAVRDEDEERITGLVNENPTLIDYQEPTYGKTLLMLTIRNQQKKPFFTLLNLNADVGIHDNFQGSSALIEACRFDLYDIEFIEQLLKKGANPNDAQVGTGASEGGTRHTALMAASISGRLDFVELLVRHGADITYQNEFKQSALTEATLQENYEIVLYLLTNGADYTRPIFFRPETNKDMFLVDVLREDFFPLNSPEHTQKMEVVDFLKNKGIDYWSAPVPDFIKKKAQEQYPDTWADYLEKY